jgi:DNA-binding NarL/FixJ family response regulator
MTERNETFVWVGAACATAQVLKRVVGKRANVVVVPNIDAALAECAQRDVRGIALDGSELAVRSTAAFDALRRAAPLARIVYVTRELSGDLVNQLQPLRIQVICRPLPDSAIEAFVEQALGSGHVPESMLRASIDQLRVQYQLSGRDVALFPMLLDAESEPQVRERLGIDADALQRSLRRLVRKCHMRNPERLASSVMRDALLFARGVAPELAPAALIPRSAS